MLLKEEGLRMCEASRTPITNLGQEADQVPWDCYGRGTGRDVGFCLAGSGPRAAHAEDERGSKTFDAGRNRVGAGGSRGWRGEGTERGDPHWQ